MALDSGALPVAETNTVARVDFNTAMAQLDAAFPLGKGNLGPDSVVTIKIKDLNVTPAKASLGFGRYVPRAAEAVDKGIGDFTADGNWHVNGLDLSGVVPVGAVAVVLRLSLRDDAAGSRLEIRQNVTADEAMLVQYTQVTNITIESHATLPIDGDRLLDYRATNLVFITIDLIVLGWFA